MNTQPYLVGMAPNTDGHPYTDEPEFCPFTGRFYRYGRQIDSLLSFRYLQIKYKNYQMTQHRYLLLILRKHLGLVVAKNVVLDHKDGNIRNNKPENLQLITQAQNCQKQLIGKTKGLSIRPNNRYRKYCLQRIYNGVSYFRCFTSLRRAKRCSAITDYNINLEIERTALQLAPLIWELYDLQNLTFRKRNHENSC